ncbi:Hsp20/alpha crystallin family protein [Kerstersia gyiorum]|uniref:Heat shock Hsp20 n=1 Tax=Kerstersia gyiorum TaxID=206506 RepID=A0A171KQ07_9BURK|nr:Hsp20/alpha crystallin family protein [Kerstersia gyiorum]AZV95156.1 Hsp20/alpha crystallin family protein [Bordetella sp. J329]MCO7640454.1 Hsp20/alpha crystallin family protein [Pseudomonas sp. S 311-6]KKO70974.1 heat shock Hsp20 [Kerstersia gyiorum]MCH4271599.1 Hsp20/alpha crystallin family protein [Kerstersia gyiorum]MCI1228965.1 Hsp20/alpha crystallin family protein [Kerstersia gyiorum]
MSYRSLFPRDVFAELDRLQRAMQQAFDGSHSIRGGAKGYPGLNIATSPKAVDIHVFVPGVEAKDLDVQIEKGVLTISGERAPREVPEQATLHVDERFAGRFRRVVSLPDDVEAQGVQASYRDGVLSLHIPRKEAAQPRRIAIQ